MIEHIESMEEIVIPSGKKVKTPAKGVGNYNVKLETAVLEHSHSPVFYDACGEWELFGVIMEGDETNVPLDQKMRCSCTHIISRAFIISNEITQIEMQIGMCCIKKFPNGKFEWISNTFFSDLKKFIEDGRNDSMRMCLTKGVRDVATYFAISSKEAGSQYVNNVRKYRNDGGDDLLSKLIWYELPIIHKFVTNRTKYHKLMNVYDELNQARLNRQEEMKKMLQESIRLRKEREEERVKEAALLDQRRDNLHLALSKHWLTIKEYAFMLDMVRKTTLTPKQAKWRNSIIKKLRNFERREQQRQIRLAEKEILVGGAL